MAFWRHATADRSGLLSLLYRAWYHSIGNGARSPLASRSGRWPVSGVPEEHRGVPASLKDGVQYMGARSFAVPVQVKRKEEPNLMQGPRINEAISARFIRLVTDEGHGVVSREEALDRARRLDLDLVEVQRTAKPPVCRIMDYHKEKYKKETMEKERAKSRSESTIRKGNFKEVRLKGKIEQKDIEVKAEAVKGLIERGYRVKCMALPSKQRGTEECDLGALLSRLTDLLEDVIIVESGPFVENQQAYVVVRHVKFGSKKGSRKKATKVGETTPGTERAASISPTAFGSTTLNWEAVEPTDTNGETEDEVLSDPEDDVEDLPGSATTGPSMFDCDPNKNVTGSSVTGKLDSLGFTISGMTERSPSSETASNFMKARSERDPMDRHMPSQPSHSDFSHEDSNRYSRRIEMKHRPDQTKPTEREGVSEVGATYQSSGFSSSKLNKFSRLPSAANSQWAEPQRSNKGNILQQPPAYENQQRERLDLKQGQMPPFDSLPASSYGIFSSPKPSSDDQRMASVNRDKEESPLRSNKNVLNIPKSKVETTGQNNDVTKKVGWGIFNGPISNPSQDKSSGQR